MMPIVFHEEAHAEMIGAAEWYNRQQPNVGEGFLDEIDIVLERIAATPEAFGFFRGKVQYLRLHRFPYAVLYYRRTDNIFIVAVMHLHREPDYWIERIPRG
jgi:plasmid stabilization system protein ParE